MLRRFLIVSFEVLSAMVFSLPRFQFTGILKSFFLRLQGAKVGSRVVYYPGIKIGFAKKLELGDDVDLAWHVIVTTGGGVCIGDRTLIGYGSRIISTNHLIPENNGRIFGSGHMKAKTIIENDCWIGANCVILPGVRIGEGAIVAAGTVVTKDIAPFSINAGVPNKEIKKRK